MIPRFHPSFATRELGACLGAILRPGHNADLVERLEKRFADYIGVEHAVMVPSARLGLSYVLDALGLDQGSEVAVPALTYHSIPAAIIAKGLKPNFVDIDRHTLTLDPTMLDFSISPQTRAIIPTHLYGKPCDMDAVLGIAKERGLAVIEDCAQSVGAEFRGKKVGGLGDAAYYTFGVTKNLTTILGGMVTTNRDDIASTVRERVATLPRMGSFALLKASVVAACMAMGTSRVPFSLSLGLAISFFGFLGLDPVHDAFNERPHIPRGEATGRHAYSAHPAQAAVGLVQLDRCDALNDARAALAARLIERLGPHSELVVPQTVEHEKHIFVTFTIQTELRDELARFLRSHGVDTAKGYMDACPDLPIFADYHRPCPTATQVKQTILHLPLYASMTERDTDRIADAVGHFFDKT